MQATVRVMGGLEITVEFTACRAEAAEQVFINAGVECLFMFEGA